jgi:Uncharacterized protein conserved in bacteria
MKIKFNWGTGIVIAFVIMIGGMVTLVSIAVRQNYDLVEKDYYEKSVDYQKHIDHVKNTDALTEKIRFDQHGDSIKLTFPQLSAISDYSGEIHFYSPVEANRDQSIKIKLDAGFAQSVNLRGMKNGRYTIKVDWTANKTSYYQEQEITVGEN